MDNLIIYTNNAGASYNSLLNIYEGHVSHLAR